jgi:preprotein translocase subunit Sec61beta
MSNINFMGVGVIGAGCIGLFVIGACATQIQNTVIVGVGALVMALVMIWGILIAVSTSDIPAVTRSEK